MKKGIYRTPEGRKQIEDAYECVLSDYLDESCTRKRVPTDTAETHILQFGSRKNKPVLFLHGSMSNSASWLGAISHFKDSFCMYCVDIPGEPGLSDAVRLSPRSKNSRRWLESLLKHLQIDRCAIVGMSLGSWYALDFAIHHPKRVSALSLLASGGIVQNRKAFLPKAIILMMLGSYGRRKLNFLINRGTEISQDAAEFQILTEKHFIPMRESLPVFSDAEIISITAALQYFGGAYDILLNTRKTADRLAKLLPSAEVNVLPETGHVILNQFSSIRKFLLKHT